MVSFILKFFYYLVFLVNLPFITIGYCNGKINQAWLVASRDEKIFFSIMLGGSVLHMLLFSNLTNMTLSMFFAYV